MIAPDDLILLDTNILLHIFRGKEPGRRIRDAYNLGDRPERPFISIVTVGEILAIARRQGYGPEKQQALDDQIRELVVVDIRRPIAEHYADLQATLQAIGRPIGENDTWIAATARATGAVLLTDNYRHFGTIPPGLIRVELTNLSDPA